MIKRILSLILSIIMLVSAVPMQVFAEEITEVTEHQHSWDGGTVTPPTCTAAGYTTYACIECGESYTGDETGATGHSWGEGVVTAPTCDAVGYTTYACTVCGGTKNEDEVAALGHSWGEGVVTAPTCDAVGYTTYTCTVCGGTKNEDEVAALGHSWGEGVVTAPTCDTVGCTTYTCTVCGGTKNEDEVAALGHSWGDWTVVLEPTVKAEGKQERECAVCFDKEEEAIEKLPPVLAASVQIIQKDEEGNVLAEEDEITELAVGDTLKLYVSILPEDTTDKTVLWTSSDEAIVTVDDSGKVTAVAAGKVKITAACGEVKGTFDLEIVRVPVTAIEITAETDCIIPGETLQLTATVLPENATDKTVL